MRLAPFTTILTNELFDFYHQYKVAKEIWDALTKKNIVEDVGTQKYVIETFRKFQMTEDIDVSSKIHDCHILINDQVIEDIKLPNLLWLGYIIETLLDS